MTNYSSLKIGSFVKFGNMFDHRTMKNGLVVRFSSSQIEVLRQGFLYKFWKSEYNGRLGNKVGQPNILLIK